MTVEIQIALAGLILALGNLLVASGIFVYVFRVSYKWNVMQDRQDLLYNEYCKTHNIPFVGLRNDFK